MAEKCELCDEPGFFHWNYYDYLCEAHGDMWIDANTEPSREARRAWIDAQKAQQPEPWPGLIEGRCSACGKDRIGGGYCCDVCFQLWRRVHGNGRAELEAFCRQRWEETHRKDSPADSQGHDALPSTTDQRDVASGRDGRQGSDEQCDSGSACNVPLGVTGVSAASARPAGVIHCAECHAELTNDQVRYTIFGEPDGPGGSIGPPRCLDAYCFHRIGVDQLRLVTPQPKELRAAWDWDPEDCDYEL